MGEWQPIEEFVEPERGEVLLWGYRVGWQEQPSKHDEPEVLLMHYTYEKEGKRVFASTETYYTDEIWYVEPTHFMLVPDPPE